MAAPIPLPAESDWGAAAKTCSLAPATLASSINRSCPKATGSHHRQPSLVSPEQFTIFQLPVSSSTGPAATGSAVTTPVKTSCFLPATSLQST